MKILIKGNVFAEGYLAATDEEKFHADVSDYNEADYDVIIDGDINIKGMFTTADIYVTGVIIAMGFQPLGQR